MAIYKTSIGGKPIATVKLASQLRRPAMDMAGGLGPCLNNSAPINCGIEPTNILCSVRPGQIENSNLGTHTVHKNFHFITIINAKLIFTRFACFSRCNKGNFLKMTPCSQNKRSYHSTLTPKESFSLPDQTEPYILQ